MRTGRAFSVSLAVAAAVLLAACGEGVTSTPPRPTVAVITAEGPYFAGFDTADEWLVGGGGNSHGVVQNGVYVLGIEQPEWLAWTRQPRAFGDGVYEVDARLASGPEGSAFGLLLLGSSDLRSFFYCMITGDGRYDIGYCEDACRTQQSLIDGFTLGYAILTGGEFNRLRVELQNGELTFIVNGSPLSQVGGLEYGEGLVGLVGESGPYGGFEAEFDNLQVVEGVLQAAQ